MYLSLSKHASRRQRQRGFSILSLRILEQFARERKDQGNGATELFFGRKEAAKAAREFKRLIQTLDKVTGSTMVISDSHILTLQKN